MNDDDFVQAFLGCRVVSSDFDHRGHLRIAWLLLKRFPLQEAVDKTCNGIAQLAAQFGVPDKYHRTMSEALVRLMAAACEDEPNQTFAQFLETNPMLVMNTRDLLGSYYSAERLASPQARRQFLEPDLRALPR